MINLKIKIFDIEKETDLFIIDNENFNQDVLIGLNIIQKFKLIQDENLNIKQKRNIEKKIKNVVDIATHNPIPDKESEKNENVEDTSTNKSIPNKESERNKNVKDTATNNPIPNKESERNRNVDNNATKN